MMMFIRRMRAGLRHRPMVAVANTGLLYSAVWTAVESADFFAPGTFPRGRSWLALLALASLVFGVLRAAGPGTLSFLIRNTTTRVRIEYGDLFQVSTAVKAIPVNEFFDSELGELVSPASVHGQLINLVLGGHGDALDRMLAAALDPSQAVVVPRARGKQNQYPIGTAVSVQAREVEYLLFALARTDVVTHKASADIPDLYRALTGLWRHVRIVGNGRRVAVPLAGGGLSGVGVSANQLLYLMLMSLVEESKRRPIGGEVQIIIHPSYVGDVDLNLLYREWA
jgi:hypothetical protein